MMNYQETSFQTSVEIGGLDQERAFTSEEMDFNIAFTIVDK